MKNIRDMSYTELYDFLQRDIKLTEEQFIQVKTHRNVEDVKFWGRYGNIREYTVEILKDNGNGYGDVDIFVREEE